MDFSKLHIRVEKCGGQKLFHWLHAAQCYQIIQTKVQVGIVKILVLTTYMVQSMQFASYYMVK